MNNREMINRLNSINNVKNLNAQSRNKNLKRQINSYNGNLHINSNSKNMNFHPNNNANEIDNKNNFVNNDNSIKNNDVNNNFKSNYYNNGQSNLNEQNNNEPNIEKNTNDVNNNQSNINQNTNGNNNQFSRNNNSLNSQKPNVFGMPNSPLNRKNKRDPFDKISNNDVGKSILGAGAKKNIASNLFDKFRGGEKEIEDETSDGGMYNFKIPNKVIKYILIAMPFSTLIVVFCCLFISASQTYLQASKLGFADDVSSDNIETFIDKKDEDTDEEMEIDDIAFDVNSFDGLNFANRKLESSNLVLTSSKSNKYNEVDLSQLEDFYPSISGSDDNLVYDFFYKMYNLYKYYKENYNVEINLPLLMATLNLQSDDSYVVFESNLDNIDRTSTKRKKFDDFDFNKDWKGYKTNEKESTHDMEVLVQNMFSNQNLETCDEDVLIGSDESEDLKDSENSEKKKCEIKLVYDEAKYEEFLKEFIEKKYYLDGKTGLNGGYAKVIGNPSSDNSSSSDDSNNNQSKPSSGDWREWKQCGGSWGQMTVPTSSNTMCKIGCLITSLAIQIKRSGTKTIESPVDPGVAMKNFSFVSGGNLLWGSVQNFAPNFIEYTTLHFEGMSKKGMIDLLSKYEKSNYYVVLFVTNANIPSHYVALDYIDTKSSEIYMIDPAKNTNPKLFDIYNLRTAIIYEKRD